MQGEDTQKQHILWLQVVLELLKVLGILPWRCKVKTKVRIWRAQVMIAGQRDGMGTVFPNNSHSRCKDQVLWGELILGPFLCGTGRVMGRKLMRSQGRKCYTGLSQGKGTAAFCPVPFAQLIELQASCCHHWPHPQCLIPKEVAFLLHHRE